MEIFQEKRKRFLRKYLQIDFDFYILWQWNKASFVQMCCCRCKVIFYNSIIHVSTFGFSKPPKKLGNKWKEQKIFFSFHATFMVNEFDLHWKKWAKTALKVRMTFNCSRTRSKLKKIWFIRSWVSISFCLWGQHFNNSNFANSMTSH